MLAMQIGVGVASGSIGQTTAADASHRSFRVSGDARAGRCSTRVKEFYGKDLAAEVTYRSQTKASKTLFSSKPSRLYRSTARLFISVTVSDNRLKRRLRSEFAVQAIRFSPIRKPRNSGTRQTWVTCPTSS